MKRSIALLTFVFAAAAGSVLAQSAPGPKVAFIDTTAFSENGGIARFIKALDSVNAEFIPRRAELEKMQARFTQLEREIKAAAPGTQSAKVEEAERLQSDLRRKAEDAQSAYDRRRTTVLTPISTDIGAAIAAFAKMRGIEVILDASKLMPALLHFEDKSNITKAFIDYYNAKYPATP